MKKLLKYGGIIILLLLVVMISKTIFTGSLQPKFTFKANNFKDSLAVKRLAQSLTFPTISYDDSGDNTAKTVAFENLYTWMEAAYPAVFKNAEIEKIGLSRIITLKGKNTRLKPALFLAHLDVVPADDATTGNWQFPPFAGQYTSDTIYGRGVLDDKCIATALLEAMESMILGSYQPQRTIILAFGHDEETGGKMGASKIAMHLKSKGIVAEFICDEGFGIMEKMIPGVSNPVAMIGVAEKGFLSVKLTVNIAGGHSSMPKEENATGLLANALSAIEKAEFYETFCEPQKLFFRTIAPEASLLYRFLFSNLWITAPAVKMVLKGNEKTAATIRTTHATTVIKAGLKENIMPNYAEATVNFRILPGQTLNEVMKRMKAVINNNHVKLTMLDDRNEPSPVSPNKGFAWDVITSTIHECFENTLTAPALVITGTDCKNYTQTSTNIYRFTPLRLFNGNIGGIHGANEKLAVKNYYEVIHYYRTLFAKL